MAVSFNALTATCEWLAPTSNSTGTVKVDQLETARQEFVLRIGQRADLSEFERSSVLNIGTAILQSDFTKLQAILKSYRHYPEQFARLAYILATELRCPEISILKVAVMNWKAASMDTEHKICVITLRVNQAHRFIDISTDANYGVNVFADKNNGLVPKLTRVSEDPQSILKKLAETVMPAPESPMAAWWN